MIHDLDIVLLHQTRGFNHRFAAAHFHLSTCERRRNHADLAVIANSQEYARRQQDFRFADFRGQRVVCVEKGRP